MAQATRNTSVFMYLIAFPMLIIPYALYNIIAFVLNVDFHQTVFSVPLLSGRDMDVSTGDVLLLLGVLLLGRPIFRDGRYAMNALIGSARTCALLKMRRRNASTLVI
jgi:hypothetical protein